MARPASAARREPQLRNTSATLAPALALDLGGTRLRGAVVAGDGRLVNRHVVPTPQADAATLLAACVDVLRRVLAAAPRLAEPPVAIGISAPGPIDARRGLLIDPPNLHRSTWGLPLAQLLADELGLPAAIEKDTNVAALGESWFGSARGIDDFIYLTVSTGIGGAAVSGGRLLTGPDGVAGELGHICVDAFEGPMCGCGARGHLEALASGTGIAAAARAAGMGDSISAAQVAAAEAAGDARAGRIMDRARQAFAAALVTIVDVFNPSLIVVGGGIATGQGDTLLEPARRAVASQAFKVQARRAKIVLARLGDDVGLVGALVLANAAVDESTPALGLKPGAMSLGRSALSSHPARTDDEKASNPTTDAVALG